MDMYYFAKSSSVQLYTVYNFFKTYFDYIHFITFLASLAGVAPKLGDAIVSKVM